jgi:hypothetical protein
MDEVKKLLKGHPNLSIEENEDGKCKVYNFNISCLTSGFMLMLFHIRFIAKYGGFELFC